MIFAASLPAPGSVSPKAPQLSAARQIRQVLLLLFIIPEQPDRHLAEPRVRTDDCSLRGADFADFLHREPVAKFSELRPFVLPRNRDPKVPQFCEFSDVLLRKDLRLVVILYRIRNLCPEKLPEHFPEQLVFGGKFVIVNGIRCAVESDADRQAAQLPVNWGGLFSRKAWTPSLRSLLAAKSFTAFTS